ncbi:MAG: Hsp33 family molecular chaperone HslO [Arenicellales bacterium]
MIESARDSCHRFIFDDSGIRGQIVSLSSSVKIALEHKNYPAPLSSLLGQAMTAAALLADTIKMEGSLILQVQGDGPAHTLVAQATDDGDLRGMIHYTEGVIEGNDFRGLVGDGKLVLTIDASGSERYQGVVAIEGGSLAEAIEFYFDQSEQLPTRVWLSSSGQRAGGIMLQKIPGENEERFRWDHLVALTHTVTDTELIELDPVDLIQRLYHQESVTIYQPVMLRFRCGCSRGKIESVLLQLGQSEIEQIAENSGEVSVECEFCNQKYDFDAVDISALFRATTAVPELRQ